MSNENMKNIAIVSGFYRLNKMCELLGLGKTTIWDLSRHDPEFPKPVKLTSQCTAWRADEVQAWINSPPRAALRRGANNA